jgi:hypothetical protein
MRAVLSIALVLTLTSCSQPPPSQTEGRRAAAPTARPDRTGGASGEKKDGNDDRDRADRSEDREPSESGGSSEEAPSESGSGSETRDAEAPSGDTPYPDAGRYTYAQEGWEEFCQAACDRQDLPDRQTLKIELRGANSDRAVVEAEAQQSSNRTTRTTLLFTRDSALITNVYAKVAYSGFTFEENYEPDPPVRSLLFPLSVGRRWSGEWKADTSGDYSVSVTGRESIEVDGRRIDAFVVSTSTDFRGEYDGSADITAWVDPETRSIVKSTGKVHLESRFGSYGTEFEITMLKGPGY